MAAFCVVSTGEVSAAARDALRNSARALGYSSKDMAFVRLTNGALTTPQLFELIEGLDPLAMVVCDLNAQQVLEQAYRTSLPNNDCARLLGKPCCCFANFDAMLGSEQTKQQAWAILKLLPRR